MPDAIRIDQDSVLARYADWHGRLKRRAVAAVGPETHEAMLFVADEVLIDGADSDLAQELQERYGAAVVAEAPLPSPPDLLSRRRDVDVDAIPRTQRLRFPAPAPVDDRAGLLERLGEDLRVGGGELLATSDMGASVAAVVVRHALDGRSIGLNLLGEPAAMPLSTAIEGAVPGAGANPFAWSAFAGRSRMVDAWQLVDSVHETRGDRMITIGVLDNGFWLDGKGVPMVPPGQPASDFSRAFIGFNLQAEGQPAGGAAPTGYAWHGNGTASTAAAVVNNALGAAGSGGTVATPVFFKTDMSIDQILRCVRICAWWGIDVLNMSFGIWGQSELAFPTGDWDRAFQFAFENDVVMVAAAGNFGVELPEDDLHVRPATRTPGVLAVGALDPADNARSSSDYGSSVWLWAPGTSIPVAPDGGNPAGTTLTGTSVASPIVAGVAAMMRYVDDGLSAAEIQRILVDTGWPGGDGRVSKGLDAFGAVFAALRGVLPDNDEPNDTPAAARDLQPVGPGGALVPGAGGFTARSRAADADYWRFRVERFSTVTVSMDWYERLATLFVAVEAEDPETIGPSDMTMTGGQGSGKVALSGTLPPGVYRVRVGGTGVTGYQLIVTRRAEALTGDVFEANDDFDQASRLLFEAVRDIPVTTATFGPGAYDATLHQERGVSLNPHERPLVMDDDYFRLDVPAADAVLRRPTVSVFDSDAPLDVTLYDAAHAVIGSWTGVHSMSADPPRGTTCFLKVSGTVPTRYRISTRMRADAGAVPGIEQQLEVIPKWWGDPPAFHLEDVLTDFAIAVNEEPGDGRVIAFQRPDEALQLALVGAHGEVLREAEAVDGRLVIDTQGIEPGTYVLRAARPEERSNAKVRLRTAPPLA